MLQLARATRALYYPEFLPDAQRPAGLPWASMSPEARGLSESFGTIRYGNLAEVLLYDARRTLTLAGPTAVLLDPEVETWLNARAASTDVEHLVHAPSLPPGWSSGKWCDWYPDLLGKDGELTTRDSKPYWQPGWLAQHDRIITALAAMKARAPLMVGGDLHAVAAGQIRRSGLHDFSKIPSPRWSPGRSVRIRVAGPLTRAALRRKCRIISKCASTSRQSSSTDSRCSTFSLAACSYSSSIGIAAHSPSRTSMSCVRFISWIFGGVVDAVAPKLRVDERKRRRCTRTGLQIVCMHKGVGGRRKQSAIVYCDDGGRCTSRARVRR